MLSESQPLNRIVVVSARVRPSAMLPGRRQPSCPAAVRPCMTHPDHSPLRRTSAALLVVAAAISPLPLRAVAT